MKLPFSP